MSFDALKRPFYIQLYNALLVNIVTSVTFPYWLFSCSPRGAHITRFTPVWTETEPWRRGVIENREQYADRMSGNVLFQPEFILQEFQHNHISMMPPVEL